MKTITLILTALALAASTATAASARSYTAPAPCPPFVSDGGRTDACTPVQNALLGFLAKRVAGAHDSTSAQKLLPTYLKGRLLSAACGPQGPPWWNCTASTAVVKTAKVNGKLVRTRIVRKWNLQISSTLSISNPDPANPPSPSPINWGFGGVWLTGSTSTRLA